MLARALPLSDLGPVDFRALRRFASICFSVLMMARGTYYSHSYHAILGCLVWRGGKMLSLLDEG